MMRQMQWLLIVMFVIYADGIYANEEIFHHRDLTGCNMSVMFLLDGSSSVGESNFQKAKDTVEVFINKSSTDVKIGFLIFGTDLDYFSIHSNVSWRKAALREAILPNNGRDTYLALYSAKVLIGSKPMENQRKVLILVTVGPADNGRYAITAANEARAADIDVYAIGVLLELQFNSSQTKNFNMELQQIAPGKVTVIRDFTTITETVMGVFNRLCPGWPAFTYHDNSAGHVGCPAFTYHDNSTGHIFTIREVLSNETGHTDDICQVDKRPYGYIECFYDNPYSGKWGEFQINPNCDLNDLPDSGISNSLKRLMKVDRREANTEDVLQTVVNITVNTTLTELDLLLILDILEQTNAGSATNDHHVESVLNIFTNVLQSPETALLNAQSRGNVGNRILEIMDTVTGKLSPKSSGHNILDMEPLVTGVWDLKSPYFPHEPQLFVNETPQASISFPNRVLQKVATRLNGDSIHLAMTFYKDTRLFDISESVSPNNYSLNSKVIAAKFVVDGGQVTDLSDINVTTTFLPRKKLPLEIRKKVTTCVYWNFTANDYKGSWSADGCYYMGVVDDLDVCLCDHLTNFAVLVDFGNVSLVDPIHKLALSIITITGLSFSIFGLSVTIFAKIVIRKLRQTDSQKTVLNLALAELCAWIVFLAGFNQAQSHVGCIVAAAMLHYFILASFMWMLAEAVMHYRLFVKVLGTYSHRYMLKMGIPAWGIPFLPVIAVISTDASLYKRDEYCWLSLKAMYYAFALPVALIILCNIIIYIMIVINIFRKPIVTLSKKVKRDRTQTNVKVSFLIFVLFGLSWTFGFMAVSDAKVVFQYIFCITSSTQGFLIFLFFIALNSKHRDRATAFCCRKKSVAKFNQRCVANGPGQNIGSTYEQDSDSHTNQKTQMTARSLEMQERKKS